MSSCAAVRRRSGVTVARPAHLRRPYRYELPAFIPGTAGPRDEPMLGWGTPWEICGGIASSIGSRTIPSSSSMPWLRQHPLVAWVSISLRSGAYHCHLANHHHGLDDPPLLEVGSCIADDIDSDRIL